MDVKTAVKIAKNNVLELFDDDGIVNLALEEVELDQAQQVWKITLGFSRPWDVPNSSLAAALGASKLPRTYIVVSVDNISNDVRSILKWGDKP